MGQVQSPSSACGAAARAVSRKVSRVLGIGRSTAYAAARDGSLPVLRISHRLLVPTAKLLAMIGCECAHEDG